jgi:phosphopantothenoylcysteine synthetase/decarboxylase
MDVLVTAGNTRVFIDQVRCLTNVFTGRTGAAIALEAFRRGHRITLLTSQPETIAQLKKEMILTEDRWQQRRYDTLADLRDLMAKHLGQSQFGALIHSAAVSDYLPAGVYAPAPGTKFTDANSWQTDGAYPLLVDRAAAKVKSDEPELWLRLVRAPKLIDMVRADWGFGGTLVKFKLEVDVGDEELLDRAEKSRLHSQADLMVANTFEEASSWAFVGPFASGYEKIARRDLPARLMDAVEKGRWTPWPTSSWA